VCSFCCFFCCFFLFCAINSFIFLFLLFSMLAGQLAVTLCFFLFFKKLNKIKYKKVVTINDNPKLQGYTVWALVKETTFYKFFNYRFTFLTCFVGFGTCVRDIYAFMLTYKRTTFSHVVLNMFFMVKPAYSVWFVYVYLCVFYNIQVSCSVRRRFSVLLTHVNADLD